MATEDTEPMIEPGAPSITFPGGIKVYEKENNTEKRENGFFHSLFLKVHILCGFSYFPK